MDERPEGEGPASDPARKRRKRYSGKNPRRFEQRYKELNTGQYPDIVPHVRQRGRTPAGTHVPILLEEVLRRLAVRGGDVVCDCTLGYGGHAEAFCRRIGPSGRLIGLDLDGGQLERARERLAGLAGAAEMAPMTLIQANYAAIRRILAEHAPDGCDVIFADLGLSSMQLDDPARGFSYKHDGPLDMRMDPAAALTAGEVLARSAPAELSAALWELADEEDHAAIAQAIVESRDRRPIRTTAQLVQVVLAAKGLARRGVAAGAEGRSLHPAAKTFQALRLIVNRELDSLRELLRAAPALLRPEGRIGIISFHSGEDRLVKAAFRHGQAQGVYAAIAAEIIRPSPQEQHDNPRSSAAKFRWARRSGG